MKATGINEKQTFSSGTLPILLLRDGYDFQEMASCSLNLTMSIEELTKRRRGRKELGKTAAFQQSRGVRFVDRYVLGFVPNKFSYLSSYHDFP